MIKKICICDRCEKETELALIVNVSTLDLDTGDIDPEWPPMVDRVHVCYSCAEAIRNMFPPFCNK